MGSCYYMNEGGWEKKNAGKFGLRGTSLDLRWPFWLPYLVAASLALCSSRIVDRYQAWLDPIFLPR